MKSAYRQSQPPPKGKNPNPSGLGRAIINKKVKDARHARESGLVGEILLQIMVLCSSIIFFTIQVHNRCG